MLRNIPVECDEWRIETLREKGSDKNSFPPRGQKLATTCYLYTRIEILLCVCILSQCARVPSENDNPWACGATSETSAKWWIRDKMNMDISLLFRFEIPQRLENISEVVESSAWAHHTVADPHRPLITSQMQNTKWSHTFPSHPPAWHDPLMMLGSTFTPSLSSFRTGNSISLWRSESFVTGLLRGNFETTEHSYQDINLTVADCFSIISFTNRPLDVDFKRFI